MKLDVVYKIRNVQKKGNSFTETGHTTYTLLSTKHTYNRNNNKKSTRYITHADAVPVREPVDRPFYIKT
jgi:hypothetical protein